MNNLNYRHNRETIKSEPKQKNIATILEVENQVLSSLRNLEQVTQKDLDTWEVTPWQSDRHLRLCSKINKEILRIISIKDKREIDEEQQWLEGLA